MKLKKINYILFPGILLFTAYLLYFNLELLGKSIVPNKEIPIGNFIIWLGFVSYSFLMIQIYPLNTSNTFNVVLRKVLQANVILSVSWGLVAYFLSGNWAFSFKNDPVKFKLWLILTALLILIPLIVYFLYLISRVVYRK